jgi:hypothetical protein
MPYIDLLFALGGSLILILARMRGTDCFVFSLLESYPEVFSGGLPIVSLIEDRRGGGRLQK